MYKKGQTLTISSQFLITSPDQVNDKEYQVYTYDGQTNYTERLTRGRMGGRKYVSYAFSSSHIASPSFDIFEVQCSGESNRGLTQGLAFCIFVTESSDGSLLAFPTNALFFSSFLTSQLTGSGKSQFCKPCAPLSSGWISYSNKKQTQRHLHMQCTHVRSLCLNGSFGYLMKRSFEIFRNAEESLESQNWSVKRERGY